MERDTPDGGEPVPPSTHDTEATGDLSKLQADVESGAIDPSDLSPGLQDALGADTAAESGTGFQSQAL